MFKQYNCTSLNNKLPTHQFDVTRMKMHLDTLKNILNNIECHKYDAILSNTDFPNPKSMQKIQNSGFKVSQINNELKKSLDHFNKKYKNVSETRDKIHKLGLESLKEIIDKFGFMPIKELYSHPIKEKVDNITSDIKKTDPDLCYYTKKLAIVKMQFEIFNYLDSKSTYPFPAKKIIEYFEQCHIQELYNDTTPHSFYLSSYFQNGMTVKQANSELDKYTNQYIDPLSEDNNSFTHQSDTIELCSNDTIDHCTFVQLNVLNYGTDYQSHCDYNVAHLNPNTGNIEASSIHRSDTSHRYAIKQKTFTGSNTVISNTPIDTPIDNLLPSISNVSFTTEELGIANHYDS